MDPSWDLYVFHGCGPGSASYARRAAKGIGANRNVIFRNLGVGNLNADEYNLLFRQTKFWDQVHAENILVFQTDAAVCKNSNFKIDDFMEYDYIGCARSLHGLGKHGRVWGPDHHYYGIGGLSFRKKSFMMDAIRKYGKADKNIPEDVFFGNCVAKSQNRPMSVDALHNFCAQNFYVSNSWGSHKLEYDFEGPNKPDFQTYCPESIGI